MTLREEFEEYVNSWNKLSTEKLFASSNKEYIKWLEDQYDNYKCDEASLDDFTEYDLVKELKDRGFDFSDEVSEYEMVDYLEDRGYIINPETEFDDTLDHIDAPMFEEIQQKFLNANWAERAELYNKIIHGK